MVQNFRVAVISPTGIVISWSKPSEAREAIDGYEVVLRQYIQKNVGTVEAVSLHKFALTANEKTVLTLWARPPEVNYCDITHIDILIP